MVRRPLLYEAIKIVYEAWVGLERLKCRKALKYWVANGCIHDDPARMRGSR